MERITYRFFIITVFLSVILASPAFADILPPNPPETQGISTSTVVSITGDLSHVADFRWDLSSEVLGANMEDDPELGSVISPEPPLNPIREVQMYVTYSEDTQAQNGVMEYRKESSVDTQANPGALFNVENERIFTFNGTGARRFFSQEDLMMNTVGTPVDAFSSTICPFVSQTSRCYPAFCNRVQTGSTIDMSTVSAGSSARLRNVNEPGEPGFWPPMPSADDPSRLQYGIRVSGLSDEQPSVGFISAYLDIQKNEGGAPCPGIPVLAQYIEIEEHRMVNGDVSLFSYLVEYESGIIR